LGLMQRYDKPGNLDQAVTALQDAVKTDAQFAVGYASLGEAYRLKNQVDPNPRWIEQSSAMLDRAVQLNDKLPSAFVSLGRLHDGSGEYDLAVQEFDRALKLDPRNAEALGGMSRAYESAGRLKEAEEALNKAVALRPDYWDVYNNLGLFYDRQNRFDEATAQLQKAIRLTPDNAQLYLNLGAVYSDTGKVSDLPDAEAALKKSIELASSYPAFANLGFVYFLQGHYSEAAEMTEKALQLNDQNYLVWRNLAEDYLWAKKPEKAAAAHQRELELLKKAVDTHPKDSELLSELATLYAHGHDADRAQTMVKKAISLSPDSGTILMNAAEVSEQLGNRAEGIQYAEQGIRKGFSLDDLKKRYALQALLADPNFKATPGK